MSWWRRGTSPIARSHSRLDIDVLVAAQADVYQNAARHFQAATPTDDLAISLVIPAYNEEQRILPTLLSIIEYFSCHRLCYEVIVVDDGSQDRTAQLVQELSKRLPSLKLIRLPRNMGKGAAVRTGVRNASGHLIIFNDADGSTPISEIERLLAAIEQGAHIAIGSRALGSSETHVERKWTRAVIGRIFTYLVNAWVVPGIADTQCGFKIFRQDVAHYIFELQQLDGFAFDVELLRLASILGYRIAEVPINWTHVPGSKVRVLRDSVRMLRDICFVRYLVPRSLEAMRRAAHIGGAAPKVCADTDEHYVSRTYRAS